MVDCARKGNVPLDCLACIDFNPACFSHSVMQSCLFSLNVTQQSQRSSYLLAPRPHFCGLLLEDGQTHPLCLLGILWLALIFIPKLEELSMWPPSVEGLLGGLCPVLQENGQSLPIHHENIPGQRLSPGSWSPTRNCVCRGDADG